MSKQSKRERQRMNREARKEYEAQLARRRKMWKTVRNFSIILVPIIVIGIVLSVTSGGDDSPKASGKCADVETPAAKTVTLPAPEVSLDPNQQYRATLETSCGTIEIDLASQQYPLSANNFTYLTEQGFYDDLAFVRAAKNHVVQAGSPTQSQTGGPGYSLQAEVPTTQPPYSTGTVAWAKGSTEAAGTIGSQFFIVTGDGSSLPTPDYAVIGTVSKGLDVAKKIEKLAPAPDANGQRDGPPTRPVVITKASIRTLGVVPPTT